MNLPKKVNLLSAFGFLIARLVLIISLPLEGISGYGDLVNFYNLANIPGFPYFHYWSEFPPIFPLFAKLVFFFTGAQQHVFIFTLVIIFSVIQAHSLNLLVKILEKLYPGHFEVRGWMYFIITIGLFYSWAYFDVFTIWVLLVIFNLIFSKKDNLAGFALAFGILLKWFPGLILGMVWRSLSLRRSVRITTISLGIVALVYGSLYVFSPEFTSASIVSQYKKGSWETIWALIDGNYTTGNFGPLEERLDPGTAETPQHNPAKIPGFITLLLFMAAGVWFYWRSELNNEKKQIAFVGLTWCVFTLWSSGWSPQWVLYLIPLIILTLPEKRAWLYSLLLLLVNLLEWPILLSRGITWGLFLTIPIRSLTLVMLCLEWYHQTKRPFQAGGLMRKE